MAKEAEPKRYIVVDNPFYDGVQLHPVGATVMWAGKPGSSLHPVDAPERKSTTDAPVFPNPLAGRGDGGKVAPGPEYKPAVLVQ